MPWTASGDAKRDRNPRPASSGTGHTKGNHVSTQRREVGGHVSGASEAICLRHEIDDRHRCFGREAGGCAPNVAIQHEVADYADAPTAQAANEPFQSGRLAGHEGCRCRRTIRPPAALPL